MTIRVLISEEPYNKFVLRVEGAKRIAVDLQTGQKDRLKRKREADHFIVFNTLFNFRCQVDVR